MISLFILLIAIFFTSLPFRKYSFEVGSFCFLAIPIELQLVGAFLPPSFLVCIALYAMNILLSLLIACEIGHESLGQRIRTSYSLKTFSDHQAMIIWILFFGVIYTLCLQWPDFISMGERLRDYALLSEVIKYPLHPTEPWLPGENLNYYLYWYRLGAVLHQITGLQVYELYHGLQAITFSLYIAALFKIIDLFGNLKSYLNWIYAILIALGSNVAGLLYAVNQSGQTWWGPSRVVKGAIDEFPVWSFLLGDLHPHYLNLPLLLLIIIWGYRLIENSTKAPFNALLLLLVVGTPLWVYNANAWEVPVLALLIGFTVLLFLLRSPKIFVEHLLVFSKGFSKSLFKESSLASLILSSAGILILFFTARHISTGGDPFRRVTVLIPLTTTKEIFLHFGFQLSLICFSTIFQQRTWQKSFVVILSLGACMLSSVALPLILTLLAFQALFLIDEISLKEHSIAFYFKGAISLTALSLLLLPELFFLDDPYGGENERMNTIFKAYSSDWAFLSLAALFSAQEALSKIISDLDLKKVLAPIFAVTLAALTLPFMFHTITERRIIENTILPREQGLSSLEREHKGAGEAIQTFFLAQDGKTAEAPGNPYSLTSHVCTLAGKQCYIGWKNHVDLLTRKYDESKRREDVVNSLFTSTSCSFTKSIMEREDISYIVIGPLERVRYGAIDENNFSCLTSIVSNESYHILKR